MQRFRSHQRGGVVVPGKLERGDDEVLGGVVTEVALVDLCPVNGLRGRERGRAGDMLSEGMMRSLVAL